MCADTSVVHLQKLCEFTSSIHQETLILHKKTSFLVLAQRKIHKTLIRSGPLYYTPGNSDSIETISNLMCVCGHMFIISFINGLKVKVINEMANNRIIYTDLH